MIIDKKYYGIIEKCPVFSLRETYSVEEILSVLKAEIKEYSKGDFIHRTGEPFSKFGILLSGSAQACLDDIEGNRMIMAEINPGSTFGESLCYLEIKDSPVYVYCSEKAEVLWLDPQKIRDNCETKLELNIQKNYTKMLALRTLSMNTRIQVLSKLRLKDKILTYLNSAADNDPEKTFSIPLSREDLATYIGCDRAALSRELSALKKAGVIDYYKNTFKILKT